jgi:hypothetical protein
MAEGRGPWTGDGERVALGALAAAAGQIGAFGDEGQRHAAQAVINGATRGIYALLADGLKISGPTISGPTISGPTISGPTISGPEISGPTIAGDRVGSGSDEEDGADGAGTAV